jgi:hypothetical protein
MIILLSVGVDSNLSASSQQLTKYFSGLESLELSLGRADVYFALAEGSSTRVVFNGDPNSITMKDDAKNLKILSTRQAGLGGDAKAVLVIHMPKIIRNVKLNIANGSIFFQHGTSATLAVSGGMLTFTGNNILGPTTFRVGNGTVTLNYNVNKLTGPVNMDIFGGRIEMTADLSEAFKAVSNSLKGPNINFKSELPIVQGENGGEAADFNISGMVSEASISLKISEY